MCKLLIIPNVSSLSKNRLKKLISHIAPIMTERDNDGFGYAFQAETGIYSERFLNTDHIRPMRPGLDVMPGFLTPQSDFTGTLGAPSGGLVAHSRMSTNVVTLAATHPFTSPRYAFAHNGVVTNVGMSVPNPSGNDSELLFEHFKLGGIAQVASSVSGYYACGILDAEKKQTIVFKDATAKLIASYSKTLGSIIFATTPEILDAVGGFLKESMRVFDVSDNTYLVFNASGVKVCEEKFQPIARSFGALDLKSLGYVAGIDDTTGYDWAALDDSPRYREHDVSEIYCTDEYGRELTYTQFCELDLDAQNRCHAIDRFSA